VKLTIVMPVLNEAAAIAAAAGAARAELAPGDELLVVDGGSGDGTAALAAAAGAVVVASERGRGRQMNAGAAAGHGDVLLFLHADTTLPRGFRPELEGLIAAGVRWGHFDIEFDEGGPLLRLIARLISNRSRIMRSATGDQAIFVVRSEFDVVGGYRERHLFEDVDLARRLRERSQPAIPRSRVVTSSRRWRNRGVWGTTLRMWTLKSLYLAGVRAETLERFYGDER
jgi:rSAM/selenodomain-associated transferase 2